MVHSESNNLSTATPVPNNNAIEVKIGQNKSMLNSMNAPASTILYEFLISKATPKNIFLC